MVSGEQEVEVKIALSAISGWSTRLAELGFSESKPRVFEVNIVFDTPERALLESDQLLRLRQTGSQSTLTWKGKGVSGPHKSRPEIECGISGSEQFTRILHELRYEAVFRYEKYRTEYQREPEGVVTLDETPIGEFLELEGGAAWIDATAAQFGFRREQYVLDSYGQLYRRYCAERGQEPTHMIFKER